MGFDRGDRVSAAYQGRNRFTGGGIIQIGRSWCLRRLVCERVSVGGGGFCQPFSPAVMRSWLPTSCPLDPADAQAAWALPKDVHLDVHLSELDHRGSRGHGNGQAAVRRRGVAVRMRVCSKTSRKCCPSSTNPRLSQIDRVAGRSCLRRLAPLARPEPLVEGHGSPSPG